MANGGWYGTQEEWALAEQPLPALDPVFEQFAAAHAFDLSKNLKDWPERSLRKDMPMSSLLQVFRADLQRDAWNVWAVCSQDRDDERFWKQIMITRDITGHQLSSSLSTLLGEGLDFLSRWNARPEDLELATKLARHL